MNILLNHLFRCRVILIKWKISNKMMPHPLPLFGSGRGCSYWYFSEYLARISIYDVTMVVFGKLKA